MIIFMVTIYIYFSFGGFLANMNTFGTGESILWQCITNLVSVK